MKTRVVININSENRTEQKLSILADNKFIFRGVLCNSIGSVFLALKFLEFKTQKTICAYTGTETKEFGGLDWLKIENRIWWGGQRLYRNDKNYQLFLKDLLNCVLEQDYGFKEALLATRDYELSYPALHWSTDSPPVIITEKEYCEKLVEMRKALRERLGLNRGR